MAPENQEPKEIGQTAEDRTPGAPVDLRPAESNNPKGITWILGSLWSVFSEWKPKFPSFAYGFASCALLFIVIFMLRSPLFPRPPGSTLNISPENRGPSTDPTKRDVLADLRTVLVAQEKTLASNDRKIAVTCNHIAAEYISRKKYSRALDYLERALEIYEQSQEPDGLHLITTLNSLAVVEQALGETGQAQARLSQALQVQQKLSSSLLEED